MPASLSADLSYTVSELLPFAVLWHLAFAFWMYSLIGESPPLAGALAGAPPGGPRRPQ